jgi:2-polyprenyl-3-methyl-5-hydroxy-6-metoxy-1,4-benzoquinol methylase
MSPNGCSIRTKPCPTCLMCGQPGDILHSRQRDRLFGVDGEWNFRRCTSKSCRLLWLDPMPIEQDLPKAYANYYTHKTTIARSDRKGLRQLAFSMKRAYLQIHYGYAFGASPLRARINSCLLRLVPKWQTDADGEVRLLPARKNGRVLDLGCGSGDWLLSMRELGWQVAGIEFDENAATIGRQRGLEVLNGSLEQFWLADESFDAITLNHVVEHLPDPIGTLRECLRILRPGGKIVIFTPNGSSLSHCIYDQFWRGLEPPRHLHIFSLDSLRRALQSAGFLEVSVAPWIATSIVHESHLLWRGWHGSFSDARARLPTRLYARAFSSLEHLLNKYLPSCADCLAATAIK